MHLVYVREEHANDGEDERKICCSNPRREESNEKHGLKNIIPLLTPLCPPVSKTVYTTRLKRAQIKERTI